MEEKNKIIISYIENRLQELDRMGMDVPENNVNKLYSVFLNRVEDINIIKTKIDTVFNNSIESYNAYLDKIGFTYTQLLDTYNKIEKLNKTTAKTYLCGGLVPYVLLNEDSGRKHLSLDLLCNKKDIAMMREVFRKKDLYDPKRDSLTYTVNNIDYGFQVVIDGVKVNIFAFEEKDNGIIEYNFDCKRRIGRIKNINVKLSDYIVPYVSSDNKKYMTESLECIIGDKLLLNRERDRKDIEKIKECNGISEDKIKRLPLPVVKENRLIGDNLEFTSTMPSIKLDIPKKNDNKGFINIATIMLLIGMIVCFILGTR
mgnify:FL=1